MALSETLTSRGAGSSGCSISSSMEFNASGSGPSHDDVVHSSETTESEEENQAKDTHRCSSSIATEQTESASAV